MLNQKIREYIEQRLAAKLEPIDKALAKPNVSPEKRDQLTLEREALCEQFRPAIWLASAAQRAKQIKLVTHAPKFSHSDSKSVGALVLEPQTSKLLTTQSLARTELDVVGNAAALDVAGLLKLVSEDGTLLADQIRTGDTSALEEFTESKAELAEWLVGLSEVFAMASPLSHTLAKQLYFPVDQDYHLLSPLYASSLAHSLTGKIRHGLYSEHTKQAREARKQSAPCEFPVISYPRLAVVEYGGSKPQNISKLNSERGGRGYLLNCQPPSWQAQSQVPHSSRQFWQQLAYISRFNVRALKKHLTNCQEKPSTESVRSKRQRLVEDIADDFLQLSAQIRLLTEQVGIDNDWSAASELTSAEACLLNPQRTQQDADFKSVRERKDWLEEIGREFGQWLNNHLQTDKLNFGDLERDHWARLIKNTLVQLRDDLSFLQGAS